MAPDAPTVVTQYVPVRDWRAEAKQNAIAEKAYRALLFADLELRVLRQSVSRAEWESGREAY